MELTGYKRAAQMAFELAEQCLRDVDMFDAAWRSYMLAEAKRHRHNARWYLHMERERDRMRDLFKQRGITA